MKTIKKFLALLLALLCTCIPGSMAVYAGELPAEVLGEGAYLTEEEAAEQIRSDLQNRTESITLRVQSASSDRSAVIAGIFDRAMAHTGSGKEGDSLLWQCAWGGEVLEDKVSSGIHHYTYQLTVVYYCDAAKDAELDAAVSSVVNELAPDGLSDYEKVCAVYDYVCANVSYDEEHLGDETYLLQYTPYAALVNKTAVSQGYALLVYRLLLELGVNCRVIGGTGAGEVRCWNIVELDGLWYNLDAAWDAGAAEYSWFLKNSWNFPNHARYPEYEAMEFHREHPMAAEDYTGGIAGEVDGIICAGQCGNAAYWHLDRCGNLVIFGEGATWDFGDDVETMPEWKAWADDIVTVTVEEGIIYLGTHSFSGMSFVTEAALPESLVGIGTYAFESCKGLTNVELPADLTDVGSYAFSNCTGLTDVLISDSVTTIEAYTFYNCTSLENPELPENLIRIMTSAFHNCSSLKETVIPEGVTNIGSNAFKNCSSLTALHFRGDPPEFAGDLFTGVTATAYYPADNTDWTTNVMQNYGGSITWSHEHVYGTEVTAPTCTEQGYTTYTCTVCGDSYVGDYVSALGHTCGEYRLTLAPTRYKTGSITAVCSVCGDDVTVTLPALNSRDYTVEVTLEPTETETGTALYTWNNTGYGTFRFEVTLRSLRDRIPLGDVNGDGFVNLLDANLAAAFYSGRFDLTEDELAAADVNGDGAVNILDANLIAACYNEAIDTFPAA